MNVWDRFTLKEEYENGLRDRYDRYRSYLSSNRDIFSPTVSQDLFDKGFEPEYPDGRRFAACVTHDMDFLPITNFSRLRDSLAGSRSSFRQKLAHYTAYKTDRRFDVEYIAELDNEFGARSSFYFLSLEPSDLDFSYNVESLRKDFAYLKREGFEIGLHGGHTAYNDPKRIALEKARLEQASGNNIAGYRSHFLKFQTPGTWKSLAENGFVYDTTLAYPDCAGFRNGMCYPFRPYSLNDQAFIDIVEVPLTVMDASLFGYMQLSPDAAFDLTVDLIDRVEKVKGVFSLLWHNSYMKDEYLDLYRKLLSMLNARNAWVTSTINVVDHWTKQGLLEELEDRIIQQNADS